MAKKNYSTGAAPGSDNPFAALSRLGNLPAGPPQTSPASLQQQEEGADAGASKTDRLRVTVDRKHRRGKTATIVSGFTGDADDLLTLGKKLKVSCGTGGSVKDGEIIIQGDRRDRLVELLIDWGYVNTRGAGG